MSVLYLDTVFPDRHPLRLGHRTTGRKPKLISVPRAMHYTVALIVAAVVIGVGR
jgi:hypothetical protein